MTFMVYALPRSRTAWISKFLSYDGWRCYHEKAIYMRSLDDIRQTLSAPKTGSAETAAAQGWHLVNYLFPGIKQVVIHRPVNECVESMLAVDIKGVARYDRGRLQRNMEYGARVLSDIAKQPGVLNLNFKDLEKRATCQKLFEFCLDSKFEPLWWDHLKDQNIQVDVKAVLSYYLENKDAVDGFKTYCKNELRKLRKSGLIPSNRKK